MQEVKMYYGMYEAAADMSAHLRNGWRVHTCTMGCYMAGYQHNEQVLVVYEK